MKIPNENNVNNNEDVSNNTNNNVNNNENIIDKINISEDNPKNVILKKLEDDSVIKELDLENGIKEFTQYTKDGEILDTFQADMKTTRYNDDGTKCEEFNLDDDKKKIIIHNEKGQKLDDYTSEELDNGIEKITRLDLDGNKNEELINEDGTIDVCRTDRSGYSFESFSARRKSVSYNLDGSKIDKYYIDEKHVKKIEYDTNNKVIDEYIVDISDGIEKIIRTDKDGNQTIETKLENGDIQVIRLDKFGRVLDQFIANERKVYIDKNGNKIEEYIINPYTKIVTIYNKRRYKVDDYKHETLPEGKYKITRYDDFGNKIVITSLGSNKYKMLVFDKNDNIIESFEGYNEIVTYDDECHRTHEFIIDGKLKRYFIYDKNGKLLDDYIMEDLGNNAKKIIRYNLDGDKISFTLHGKGYYTIVKTKKDSNDIIETVEALDKTIIYSKNGPRLEEYSLTPNKRKVYTFNTNNKIIDEYISESMDNDVQKIIRMDKNNNIIEMLMKNGKMYKMIKKDKDGNVIEECETKGAKMHRTKSGKLMQEIILSGNRRKIIKYDDAGNIIDEYEIEDLPDGTYKIIRKDKDGNTIEEHYLANNKKHIKILDKNNKVIEEYEMEDVFDPNTNTTHVVITRIDENGNIRKEILSSDGKVHIRIYNQKGQLLEEFYEEADEKIKKLFAWNCKEDNLYIQQAPLETFSAGPSRIQFYRRAKSLIYANQPIKNTGRDRFSRIRSAKARMFLTEKEKVKEWEYIYIYFLEIILMKYY